MPLPPALLAKLAKRGILNAKNAKILTEINNKENQKEDEEIIAENYDESEQQNKKDSNTVVDGGRVNEETKAYLDIKFKGFPGCPNKYNVWHECSLFCKEYWGEGKKRPNRKYLYYRKKMLAKYPLPEDWIEVYDAGTGRYYYWDEENDVVSWLPPSHPRALITDSAAHFREERHTVEGDKHSDDEKKSDSDDGSSSDSSSSVDAKRQRRRYSSSDKDSDKSDDEKRSKARQTRSSASDKNNKSRRKVRENDLDPMDPASYSDIPRQIFNSFYGRDSYVRGFQNYLSCGHRKNGIPMNAQLDFLINHAIPPLQKAWALKFGNINSRGGWSVGLEKGAEAKTGVDTTAGGSLYQMRPYPNPGAVLRANAKSKGDKGDDRS